MVPAGFAKQSGGHAKIYSEVGVGTTVKLYLPRFSGAGAPARRRGLPSSRRAAAIASRSSWLTTKLWSETTPSRCCAPTRLRGAPREQRPGLLLTDVGLPGMNGRELAEAACALRPALRVLYTTGYARNAIVHNGTLDPGVDLLPKP